jgi:uncharacterized protein
MLELNNHVNRKNLVMITGATGGLGKAFAVECASRGWNLFLTDLPADGLKVLADGLRKAYPVEVITHPCDLTDPASLAQLFDAVRSNSLRFQMLLNVAGIDYEGLFFEQTSQQIRTILRLNIEGTLAMTHALLEYRNPMTPFHIINVASLAAYYPMPVKATYAASKRFLLDFSLALREEVRGLGVNVTTLCPAGLPTTPECIKAIEVQGWMGTMTTQNIGGVANQTINAALAGRPVVIPGVANRFLQTIGGMLPPRLLAALIGSRWRTAHQKRRLTQKLFPA